MGRENSDEAYVLDLCDSVLGEIGLRQHRFDCAGRSQQDRRSPSDLNHNGHPCRAAGPQVGRDRPHVLNDTTSSIVCGSART